jgi:ankyrin repeat protein
MFQPDALKSDEFQPWSRGRGTEVWAMLRACADGDLNTVRDLIAKDRNLLECEYQYHKPIHFAVRENRREVVELLLASGADPMAGGNGYRPRFKPGDDWSPLGIARERGYGELAALLESVLRERFNIVPEGETIAEIIRSRDFPRVRDALDAQPSLVHAADGFGNRLIHWAVMTRQTTLIDLLLERGADINAARPDGARPLDLTNGDYWYRGWRDVPADAIQKHEVLIGYLLARGADYDISVAAKIGDLARVRALLDENPALANRVPGYSTYYSGLPLRVAAGAGHMEVVKLLVERGANPSEPEPGIAPNGGALHAAIGGGHWEIVKLLLAHGANPNGAVESSGNCFWFAKHKKAPEEILNLIASYGGTMTTEMACYDGDVQTIAAMLYANPRLAFDEGSIHSAIDEDHPQLLELILRFQPDVLKDVVMPGVKTKEFARWLIDRGMDPKRTNWLGVSPLHRFAMNGRRDMAELCLEHGADINAVEDEYCSTPLGWAARGGQKEMVEWLLSRGANKDLPGDKSWALPIEWAKRRGHDEVVPVLQ